MALPLSWYALGMVSGLLGMYCMITYVLKRDLTYKDIIRSCINIALYLLCYKLFIPPFSLPMLLLFIVTLSSVNMLIDMS